MPGSTRRCRRRSENVPWKGGSLWERSLCEAVLLAGKGSRAEEDVGRKFGVEYTSLAFAGWTRKKFSRAAKPVARSDMTLKKLFWMETHGNFLSSKQVFPVQGVTWPLVMTLLLFLSRAHREHKYCRNVSLYHRQLLTLSEPPTAFSVQPPLISS